MTLEEFLALPETKPYREFACGEIKEKAMPGLRHSDLVAALMRRLGNYLYETGLGRVANELRYVSRAERRAYLPDVAVTLAAREHPDLPGAVEEPPDFAIEVLSPGDRAADVINKTQFYLREGVRLIWVFDTDMEHLTVYRQDAPPVQLTAADVATAAPVLPDFILPLADLFAEARRPSNRAT